MFGGDFTGDPRAGSGAADRPAGKAGLDRLDRALLMAARRDKPGALGFVDLRLAGRARPRRDPGLGQGELDSSFGAATGATCADERPRADSTCWATAAAAGLRGIRAQAASMQATAAATSSLLFEALFSPAAAVGAEHR